MKEALTSEGTSGRVIGLDLHPDVFSAAALAGRDAATARVEQQWDRWSTGLLEQWARTLRSGDLVVVEASGNTFDAAQRLGACGVMTVVLESQRAGQIRTAYCMNDRVDAVKLARVYLSGLALTVWQPDLQTRERREVLHCYRTAVADATRARNRLKSFLSDHGVRLPPGVRLTQASGERQVRAAQRWSERQSQLLDGFLSSLQQAEEKRKRLTALMAREVAQDPKLLRLLRLLGVRHIIAYAFAAVVGDIGRFPNPKKLVAYLGLAPRVETSGNQPRGPESLVRFGRGDLRALLVQAAQNALRQKRSPLHTWGWKLQLRKSHKNVAVIAIARKLAVSAWYCMRDLLVAPAKLESTIEVKLRKVATAIGLKTLRQWGYPTAKAFVEEKTGYLLQRT
ncbi:IS110 family transposase [Opitutus sp. ER46]|uniref:IS110 family transposase n=1 Tax=Opitutus sp. ER46 TaxID=2161864 RepID=UPI001304E726|nr:IS110 family transposase [Opitutus sp. ER46]